MPTTDRTTGAPPAGTAALDDSGRPFRYGDGDRTASWPTVPGPTTCSGCGASVVTVQGVEVCPDCARTEVA